MRRVLMLSYRFPPAPGVGGLRAFHFAKYLPAFGWEPVVVTSRPGAGESMDADLAASLPAHVHVRRTGPVGGRDRLGDAYRAAGAEGTNNASRLFRLTRSVLSPDGHILWWPAAVFAALRSHRRPGFDVVFATAPPNSVLVIARHLKALTGVPLVCDLRDPWTHQFDGVRRFESEARKRRERASERAVFEAADRVVVTSPEFQAQLAERYPSAAGRLVTITNGYDALETSDVTSRSFDKFAIVHTGTLGDGYDVRPFLDALGSLPERDAIEVHFVGSVDASTREAIGKSDAAPAVDVHGWMPHAEAAAFQRGADLLLVAKGETGAIAAKLFEYLAAGAPVLGILPPSGSSARFIRQNDMGVVLDPADVPGIARAVQDFLKRGRRPKTPTPPPPEYDRRHLTGRLARLLDEVSASKSA